MAGSTRVRFTSYPRTEPPPSFAEAVVQVFRTHESAIGTLERQKGLKSDEVLKLLRDDLVGLGFQVEAGKHRGHKIERPVFYGENGAPALRYEIDAYHSAWRCGLEVEAARAWMGNAVYRDLVLAMVMVQVDYLVIAVSNAYRYQSGGKPVASADYVNACSVADALYAHSRVRLPYGLVLIGY
jgi:hypothetical protein